MQPNMKSETQVMALSNVPDTWQLQLFKEVEPSSRLALFKCSTHFRDHALASSERVQLCLEFGQDLREAAAMLARLEFCRDGADVKLVVKAPPADQAPVPDHMLVERLHEDANENSTWLTTLVSEVQKAASSDASLHRITNLVLLGDVLGGVIPYKVPELFPHLQQLTRQGRFVDADRHAITPIQSLHTLTFTSALYPAMSKQWHIDQELLQQQLSQLHVVNVNLTQEPGALDQKPLWFVEMAAQCWAFVLSPLRHQLLQLQLRSNMWLFVMLRQGWPQLKALGISKGAISNGNTTSLLHDKLPKLEQLKVSHFGTIYQDYAKEGGPWKHLTILHATDLKDLPRLPLRKLESLSLGGLRITEQRELTDGQQVADFVSSLPAGCKIISPPDRKVLSVELHAVMADCDVLRPLLQLLPHPLQITVPMQSTQTAAKLHAQFSQVVAVKCYRSPRSQITANDVTSALAALCAKASRPLELVITPQLASFQARGWQQQLIDAMAAAGHQHVCVKVAADDII